MSNNVLVVKYTPREEHSRTRALLEYVTRIFPDDYVYQEVDLADELPELMSRRKILQYYRRNYEYETLTPEEEVELAQMDTFAEQLVQTDVLILACPVYNFGLPAPVKAWIDAAFQRGKVYDVTLSDGVIPLCGHLKVLAMYTAGILYDDLHGTEGMNTTPSILEANFQWIGAKDVRVVGLEGLDILPPDELDIRIREVHGRLTDICNKWFVE